MILPKAKSTFLNSFARTTSHQVYGLLAPEVHSYLGWMTENPGIHVLSDALWAELEPLINEVRPHCKVPHDNLRQTIEAILWRHQNGAKWRAIPGELGP